MKKKNGVYRLNLELPEAVEDVLVELSKKMSASRTESIKQGIGICANIVESGDEGVRVAFRHGVFVILENK